MLQTLLIALGLSMDAFAVSVSSGMCTKELAPRHAVRGAFFFGLFQAAMPILGWTLGQLFRSWISGIDHWIAFALITAIGCKMLFESVQGSKEACDDEESASGSGDVRSLKNLLVLSVATSIDALAVGLSLSLLETDIWTPAATIGTVTFLICLVGFEFGRRLGHLFERRAEQAGGIILIAIGCKTLIEHLIFL